MARFQSLLIQPLLMATALAATLHTHNASFTPDEVLHVSRANVSIGGIEKYSTRVNGSIPGPPLKFQENQVVWVRVYNDMHDDNLTMHWHGIAQSAYPFSDGTPLASQWPIPPGHFFDYELSFTNNSAGTYFYHSHVGFQATTAAGALIIHEDGSPPYAYDDERTILIQEVFNVTDDAAMQGLEGTPLVWPGENTGWLINGKTISNFSVVDNSTAKWPVIDVAPSKDYRFRFIGGHTLSFSVLGFEDHKSLSIIEADAGYTQPFEVDLLQMGAGQRYSTLFSTKSCEELKQLGKTEFYMQIETRERPNVNFGYAILRYNSTCGIAKRTYLPTGRYPDQAPLALPATDTNFLDYKLAPVSPNDFPSASEVTRRVYLNAQQLIGTGSYYGWTDDNVVWTEDTSDPLPHTSTYEPYLVALYKNQSAFLPNYTAAVANGGVDPKTKTFPTHIGEVVEIVIQNLGSKELDGKGSGAGLDTHPWHAHGAHYYDIGYGVGPYNATENEAKLASVHPVKRDTTMLFRQNANATTGVEGQIVSWRAWRLRITDPGVWMVHCHILQHMIQGMQTVWVHGDAKDILTLERPEVEGYLTYGGDVYGNSTHSPQVIHFSELAQKKKRGTFRL